MFQAALLQPQASRHYTDRVSPELSPTLKPESVSSSPTPLTLENLRNITGVDNSLEALARSQSQSSSTIASTMGPKADIKEATTVTAVRRALRNHRYYFEDPEAEQRGAALIAAARAIVLGQRGSLMSDGRADQIRGVVNEYRNANELTFLIKFWAAIVDLERQVPAPHILQTSSEEPMTDVQKEAARKWISQAWLKDHLRESYSTNFRPNSTPPISPTDDKVLDDLLKCVPRVKNPVPDLAYGIKEDAFSPRHKGILDALGCDLSSELYHVFFLVEAKSMNNPLGEAENRCCRGGAAMTYNKRKLDAAALLPADGSQQLTPAGSNAQSSTTTLGIYPKADMDSFTFSLAVDPDHANLFVHWAEETAPQTTIWHMNRVEGYDLRLPNDYRRLHHDVDNILDWGVGERLQGIRRQLEQIGERLETESNKKRKFGSEFGDGMA